MARAARSFMHKLVRRPGHMSDAGPMCRVAWWQAGSRLCACMAAPVRPPLAGAPAVASCLSFSSAALRWSSSHLSVAHMMLNVLPVPAAGRVHGRDQDKAACARHLHRAARTALLSSSAGDAATGMLRSVICWRQARATWHSHQLGSQIGRSARAPASHRARA